MSFFADQLEYLLKRGLVHKEHNCSLQGFRELEVFMESAALRELGMGYGEEKSAMGFIVPEVRASRTDVRVRRSKTYCLQVCLSSRVTTCITQTAPHGRKDTKIGASTCLCCSVETTGHAMTSRNEYARFGNDQINFREHLSTLL